MTDVILIGECMVELGLEGGGRAALAYAGILELMAAEGVGRGLVAEAPGRLPGLYAIQRDARGERSFFYWREASPARDYMSLADGPALQAAMDAAKAVYVSAITLAILGEAGRATLGTRLQQAGRAGAGLVLDTNHRPRLWPDVQAARDAVEALAPHCRIVSAAEADLAGLGLDADAARRWSAGGAEVVFRQEDRDIRIFADGRDDRIPAEPPVPVVDTTGAGDSFNAGYLAARLAGRPPRDAVAEGRRLAGVVVQHRGAIIPREAMPQA